MADINAYALGLELQLQTTPAFEQLGLIEKKLTSIEKKMANIGPSTATTAAFERQAQAVGLNAMEHHELEKATSQLMEVEREWKTFNDQVINSAEFLNLSLEEQQKQQQKLTDKYMAANKAVIAIGKSYKSFNETEKDMFDMSADISKQMDESLDQHKQLNEKYEQYTKHLKTLKPLLDAAGISQEQAAQFIGAYTKGLGAAFVAIALLGKGLRDVMAMQDAYAKTTFRALGSQMEMIDNTNQLKSSLGATTEQAVKTFTALANSGFRASDAINELAEANYMFSRSTGVSEGDTANYQRRLTSMGFTATDATGSLAKMSAAIRNSGMTAQEASGLMNTLQKSMMKLNYLFGAKQAKEAGEYITKMAVAAKTAGVDSGGVAALTDKLSDLTIHGEKLMQAMGMVGMSYQDSLTPTQNVQKFTEAAADGFKSLGIDSKFAQSQLERVGLDELIPALDLTGKAAIAAGKGFGSYVNSMDQGADLTEDFNKAMATFKETMQRILTPLMTIGSELMSVVGPAIVALLKPIVWLATAFGKLISFFDRIPGVSLLLKGAVLMVMVPAILKGITAFTGFGKSFTGLLGIFKGGMPTFKGIAALFASKVGILKNVSKETLGFAKSMLSGKASVAGLGAVLKSAIGGVAKPTMLADLGKVAGSAEGAGEGLMGMGGGALSAAMNFAKLHPAIAAVVIAIGAAFLIVPKLFEMFDSGDKKVQALGAALMVLLAPLVVFYVQLRALWAILKGVWEAVSDMLSEAFKPLVDVWKELTGGPGKKTMGLMEFMEKAMHKVTLVTKVLVKAFYPLVLVFKAIGVVVKFVAEAIKWVVNQFKPLIEWVDKAIQKVSKFLGIEDDLAKTEEDATEAADKRSEYEKMWGVQKDINDALKEQQQLMENSARRAKEIVPPEILQTIRAQGTSPTRQAEPVITPSITDKTARINAKVEEHNEKMLTTNMFISDVLSKMLGKVDNKADLNEMVDLLKTWLPKIAEEKSGGLSTAANQWV